MRRRRSFRLVMIVLSLAVALGSAQAALAKGRPLRATYTRTSCFDFTITTSWWKKLDVRGIKVELFAGQTDLVAYSFFSSAGFENPFTMNQTSFNTANDIHAVVSVYSSNPMPFGSPPPVALDSFTTPVVSFDCGL